MPKEVMIVRLLEFSIIENLKKKNIKLPTRADNLFDSRDSYYKHIHFNFNAGIDDYWLKPSFFFSNFTDICQEFKKENGKTICYTKYFIIELEDAIQNKEIEIIDNKQLLQSSKEILDINSLKNQLIDILKYYHQGLLTKKEVFSQVIYMYERHCLSQKKWNHVLKPTYFIGGIANDIN